MTGYPRDLVGYADQPPDPRWPGGARLALNFVVNYEEGGERSVLHGDKFAETRLTDLLMLAPLQGARDLNMESAYEYGSCRLLASHAHLRRAAGDPDDLCRRHGARAQPANRRENGASGLRRRRSQVALARLSRHRRSNRARAYPPLRRDHSAIDRNSADRLVHRHAERQYTAPCREEGGFFYDSDAYNDELPYWTYDYGRPHLIIPHTLDDNDTRLARGLGWGQAEDFFASLRDNFDVLYREGEQTPKIMTVALHCRLAGKPARAAAFARFVDHILCHDRVWICRRNEIAEHWRRQHPANGESRLAGAERQERIRHRRSDDRR